MHTLINYLQTHTLFFLLITTFFGLCMGSFLNVVVHRLPQMLERDWRQQCYHFLNIPSATPTSRFNLVVPRSHCPHCKHPISVWTNIPLLSFLLLRGKCASCHYAIPWRYFFLELSTALLSLFLAMHFGVSTQLLASLVFTYGLLALIVIDADQQLLPDNLTLPLLWLGLWISLWSVFRNSEAAIIGAIAGYLSLWSIAKIYYYFTGKIGMGQGDFKLLALLGVWCGWQMLPFIIFGASFVGAIVGVTQILRKRQDYHTPMPFGPYLASAGWIAFVAGDTVNQWYWHAMLMLPR